MKKTRFKYINEKDKVVVDNVIPNTNNSYSVGIEIYKDNNVNFSTTGSIIGAITKDKPMITNKLSHFKGLFNMKNMIQKSLGFALIAIVAAFTLPPYIKIPVVDFRSPEQIKTDSMLKHFRQNVASNDGGEFTINKKTGEIQFSYNEGQDILKGVEAGIIIGRNSEQYEFDIESKMLVAKKKAKSDDSVDESVKFTLNKLIEVKTNGEYYTNEDYIYMSSFGPDFRVGYVDDIRKIIRVKSVQDARKLSILNNYIPNLSIMVDSL